MANNNMVSPKALAIGAQILWAREGDTCTGGTVGVALPPTWNSDACVQQIGRCEDWEDDVKGTDEVLRGPAPGAFQRMEIIAINQMFDAKFTTNQLTFAAMEAMYRPSASQNIGQATNTFNPLGGQPRQGWIHAQRYDHENTLWTVFDLWVRLTLSGGMKSDGKVIRPAFMAEVLWSTLNQIAIN